MSMKPLALVGVLVGLAALTAPTGAAPEERSAGVTFNRDVLPILQKNCQTCHKQSQDCGCEQAPPKVVHQLPATEQRQVTRSTTGNPRARQ